MKYMLKELSVLKPKSADELNDCQKKQLEIAGKLYDGYDGTAYERLSDQSPDSCTPGFIPSFLGSLEMFSIADENNKKLYDAYLYADDSGTIFNTGTTEVVAEIIQCWVQAEDKGLAEELEKVLKLREA